MLKYGREYDFSKNFFENFQELFLEIPLSANISQMAGENTEYADTVVAARNAYLSNIVVENCEDVFYTLQAVAGCKNIFNCVQVFNACENIYFCLAIFHSYNIFYSRFIDTCRDVRFSTNMIGCVECVLCHDLENTSYCIENIQYTKEEYLQKKTEILKQKDLFVGVVLTRRYGWKKYRVKKRIGDVYKKRGKYGKRVFCSYSCLQ